MFAPASARANASRLVASSNTGSGPSSSRRLELEETLGELARCTRVSILNTRPNCSFPLCTTFCVLELDVCDHATPARLVISREADLLDFTKQRELRAEVRFLDFPCNVAEPGCCRGRLRGPELAVKPRMRDGREGRSEVGVLAMRKGV
jgi:hypothetical protein